MIITPKQNLVPTSKYSIKCPNKMEAEYICVHNTAMDASAANEIAYMIRNNNYTSYHFAIDDKEIVQGLPLNRNGWHAGDGGNGTGNRKSIGIEICYSKSGGERYKKAEQLTIKFIAQLLHERKWDVSKVKKHEDFSGKRCPHRILNEGRWNSFLNAIKVELEGFKTPPKPVNQPTITKSKGVDNTLELVSWQWDMIVKSLEEMHEDGILNSDQWITKAKEKTLTLSELCFLNTIIVTRRK